MSRAGMLAWLALAGGLSGQPSSPGAPAPNVVLVGWDRANGDTIRRLMSAGRMPRLKELVDKGSWADLAVAEGPAGGKVGWSQILTGYNSGMMGVITETRYRPISPGFTLFERLKDRLGAGGIRTALISGPRRVLSGAGPHEICANCLVRRKGDAEILPYWDFEAATPPPGLEKTLRKMDGEPLLNAARSIDVLEAGVEPRTLERSLEALERLRGGRFFAVLHFERPAGEAYRYGVASPRYAEALAALDADLGRIVDKLRRSGIEDKTVLLVTTDFGADPKDKRSSGGGFLAAGVRGFRRKGDRRDIAPTLYDLLGVPAGDFHPGLLGRSLLASAPPEAKADASRLPVVRIGYFLGGRTSLLYRALMADAYKVEGVEAELLVKRLRDDSYAPMEKHFGKYSGHLGKATGKELIDGVLAGKFDAAAIGEMSFIGAALEGKPIVAVAELGHDTKEKPGHGIVLREGLKIKDPKDLKGLRFAARRSSGGDLVMLREFLVSKGLDPDKDVTIVNNVFEDELGEGVQAGKIDGGYYHLGALRRQVRQKRVYLYQPLNWVNAEMSQSLLVFSRKYLEAHPDNVEKIVRAYMKRIRHETSLPPEERRKVQMVALVMETDFGGMNFPQYEKIPRVRVELLDAMQNLLLKHRALPRKAQLEPFIDNRIVDRVGRQLYPSP